MTAFHRCMVGLGGSIVLLWIALSVLASWFAGPNNVSSPFQLPAFPNGDHWLGTDHIGQDLFTQLLWALRRGFLLAGGALLLSYLFVGPLIWLGQLKIQPITALLQGVIGLGRAVPPFLVYILLISSGIELFVCFVISFALASLPALVERKGAWRRAAGETGTAATLRALVLPFVLRQLALCLALLETLHFFGLGPTRPPDPTLGDMVNFTRIFVISFPYMSLVPIAGLSLVLFGILSLAHGLDGWAPGGSAGREPVEPVYRTPEWQEEPNGRAPDGPAEGDADRA